MRHFSLTVLILTSILACFGQVKTNKDSLQRNVSTDLIVTLLGTGMPQPVLERFGPSILVQAGHETLLFYAGRGCLQRLRQLNISYDKIDALFLTHLHSDHIVGLPDLWLTSRITLVYDSSFGSVVGRILSTLFSSCKEDGCLLRKH